MPPNSDRIFWVDLEMSGLDPDRERILEIACILTDGDLNVLAEGPDLILHQPDEVLAGMDAWNQTHHQESGLLDKVRASRLGEAEAEGRLLDFLRAEGCPAGAVPLAGNSVHHDRRFLRRYMPALDRFLHYRIIDTTTVKELVRRWYPEEYARRPRKRGLHRALDDVRESIEELRWYRRTVFR